jgi:hypothetical protein
VALDATWAIDQLQQFISAATWAPTIGASRNYVGDTRLIVSQAEVAERIFDHVVPDWRDRVAGHERDPDTWRKHREVALRAETLLRREAELREKLGDDAPELNAGSMHPWVWDAARSLWNSGHYREAVSAVAVKVNAEAQNKLGRKDIGETKLFQEAFSLNPPEPGKPRLRLAKDDGSDVYKDWQRGAISLASGCYTVFRNVPAHTVLPELPEAEALEQLAAFSILARWVEGAALEMT